VMERPPSPAQFQLQIQPLPAPEAKPERHGFLRRIGRFFVQIFG
jgi:hypothetical protein